MIARFVIVLAALALPAWAQTVAPIMQEPQTVRLWDAAAPGALGDASEDIPTLTIYMPPNTTGPLSTSALPS
jgi:hypothetical protein